MNTPGAAPRRVFRSATLLVAGLLVAVSAAWADERQDRIVAAFEKARASLVTLTFTPKLSGPADAVALLQELERERSAAGVLVDPVGIVLACGSQVDPGDGPITRGRVTIDRPDHYTVKLANGRRAIAHLLGRDDETNLAFLKIEEDPKKPLGKLPALDPARAAKPALAQEVLIAGLMPAELSHHPHFLVTRVNAMLERPWPLLATQDAVTEYVGGAVLTLDGDFLGFVGVKPPESSHAASPGTRESPGGGSRSVTVRPATSRNTSPLPCIYPVEVFGELIKKPPQSRKVWLGVATPALQALTADLAVALGVPGRKGVIIGEVLENSPAQRADLRDGDILVRFDGKDLDVDEDRDIARFLRLIKRAGPGRPVDSVVLRREGTAPYAETALSIVLEEQPPTENEVPEFEEKDFGLKYKQLTHDVLLNLKLDPHTQGVRVTGVERAGWAGLARVQTGDILQKVDDQPVADVASFQAILAKARQEKKPALILFVARGKKTEFLNLQTEFR